MLQKMYTIGKAKSWLSTIVQRQYMTRIVNNTVRECWERKDMEEVWLKLLVTKLQGGSEVV